MDDETRGHIYESLEHMAFFQDFLRATGMVKELNEVGFYYGTDWNGGTQIIESHFETIIELLGISLNGTCESFYFDEQFTDMLNDDGELDLCDWTGEPLTVDQFEGHFGELAMVCRISGDSAELKEWAYFIGWLNPVSGSVVGYELNESGEKRLVWFIDYESGEFYERWRTLITAWKVMEFYDNVSRASEWRKLRGLRDASAESREAPTARSERGPGSSLQDSRLGTAARDAGSFDSSEHAEGQQESDCRCPAVA